MVQQLNWVTVYEHFCSSQGMADELVAGTSQDARETISNTKGGDREMISFYLQRAADFRFRHKPKMHGSFWQLHIVRVQALLSDADFMELKLRFDDEPMILFT